MAAAAESGGGAAVKGGVGVAWERKEVEVEVEVWSDGVINVVVEAKTPPAVPPAPACPSSSAIKASSDKLAK